MKKKILFLDDAFISARDNFIESLSPGIFCANGVFETMRAYHGKIFAVEKHLQRLRYGLKAIDIKTAYTNGKLKNLLKRVLDANKLKNARIRLSIWKDNSYVRIAIIAFKCCPPTKNMYKKGYAAVLSDTRRNEASILSRIKSLQYLDLFKAYKFAQRRGYDEAILLNLRGLIAEGSRSNIFFVKKRILYTPAISCGCLNGITRQIVIAIAKRQKIPCRQVETKPQQLLSCDESFLTNSLIEVMPLTRFQNKTLADGTAGPITKTLQRCYSKTVKDSLGI